MPTTIFYFRILVTFHSFSPGLLTYNTVADWDTINLLSCETSERRLLRDHNYSLASSNDDALMMIRSLLLFSSIRRNDGWVSIDWDMIHISINASLSEFLPLLCHKRNYKEGWMTPSSCKSGQKYLQICREVYANEWEFYLNVLRGLQ